MTREASFWCLFSSLTKVEGTAVLAAALRASAISEWEYGFATSNLGRDNLTEKQQAVKAPREKARVHAHK